MSYHHGHFTGFASERPSWYASSAAVKSHSHPAYQQGHAAKVGINKNNNTYGHRHAAPATPGCSHSHSSYQQGHSAKASIKNNTHGHRRAAPATPGYSHSHAASATAHAHVSYDQPKVQSWAQSGKCTTTPPPPASKPMNYHVEYRGKVDDLRREDFSNKLEFESAYILNLVFDDAVDKSTRIFDITEDLERLELGFNKQQQQEQKQDEQKSRQVHSQYIFVPPPSEPVEYDDDIL
jgi:hypothetical protein